MLKVKIISHTIDAEKVIAAAAKLCYSPSSIDDLMDNLTEESIEKFLNMLVKLGHQSPIEHASFTFAVEGVSRITEQQLTRHRVASYSIQSGRYVKRSNPEIYVPELIKNNGRALNIFNNAVENSANAYNALVYELTQDLVEELLIKEGRAEQIIKDNKDKYSKCLASYILMDKDKSEYDTYVKKVEKKAIEDARYVYPQGLATKIIFTMNARELLHFFEERCCSRAQLEIRDMATEMLRQCREICPIIFQNAGPSCVRGNCKEGKMTCGESSSVREKYKNL